MTDRKAFPSDTFPRGLLQKIRQAAAAGVDWIQIRERDLSARDLLALAREAVAASAKSETRILVNDRLDVALAGGAAGVHLGGESAPTRDVVRWCRAGHAPKDFQIGVSCHSLVEVREAAASGADYAFFGPVFDTPSKKDFGPPQGIANLAEVSRAVKIPILAIGGVTADNAGQCLRAGAAGIAAIRLFQETPGDESLGPLVQRLRQAS